MNNAEIRVIIGLDISTVATGYSVVTDGNIVDSGVIKVSKSLDLESRLALILPQILAVIDDVVDSYTYNNLLVVIEDSWCGRNVKTMKDLTTLIGMVQGYLVVNHIDYKTVKPSQWRAKLGLNRKGAKRVELKQLTYDYVTKKGNKVESEDEADACAIALAFYS